MPGMRSGINTANPVLVAAFRSALMHQGLTALLVLAALAVAWTMLRETRGRAAGLPSGPEHPAMRLVRLGFGVLWIIDGVLQGQPAMAVGLPSKVIAPAAATSPGWVRHLVEWSGTAWSYHPVQAGAAAVWIQVGIGIWMLASPRGWWSRLAGLAGLAWGLAVWVFGEAFGAIFAPGVSLLLGAPMSYLRAFDTQERLTSMRNWLYLTGSLGELHRVWHAYGLGLGAGGEDHVFVIDARGRVVTRLNADPGVGTAASRSSFAVEFSQAAEEALTGNGSPS